MAGRRQIRGSTGNGRKRIRGGSGTARGLGLLVIVSLIFGGLAIPTSAADKEPSLEYQVKAAFLLNFTKFIEWPATESAAGTPFFICILGEDPFGGALEKIVEGETVQGRKPAVQRIQRYQAQPCSIVYAGRQEKELNNFLAGLGRGVLTVGEGEQFVREGGMIAFAIENRRVRFDVNQTAAAKGGLRISSKLLNVARSVEK